MSDAREADPEAQRSEVTSAAAARGPLAMEAISISKDFRLGHGQILHAVRDVSFNLYRSAVVALVGESGSGKTTAARLLAGQERLTSGSIRVDGEPVDLSTQRAFRQYKSHVQLVFQDPFASLNPVHTVRYHLERPVRLRQGKRSKEEVGKELTTLLEQVRLTPADQFIGKYPHELSGGQRQRVSFARALAARPRVLLADEPVSMLDVSIRLEMLSLLDDLRRRFQLAMLYITHDIASARYVADEVLVMYAGADRGAGPGGGPDADSRASLHAATGRLGAGSGQPGRRAARGRRERKRPPSATRRCRVGRLPIQPKVPARRGPLPGGEPGSAAHLRSAVSRLLAARRRSS